jgi:class 3 adenylate cyclase
VLFLDIVGSTQLVQLLNPEEMQMTASGALADFTAIVSHRGGELLLDAGDKLKVAFGACDTAGTLSRCRARRPVGHYSTPLHQQRAAPRTCLHRSTTWPHGDERDCVGNPK